jgi:phospholipase C
VAGIVNAIGNNTTCDVTNGKTGYWYDTAIIVTWDDWGGWYDHVPPPTLPTGAPAEAGSFEYGFRVPMVVVSAYTPTGTISNVTNDFGSILKFVEDVFGRLVPLDPTYADAFAGNYLQEFFNFSKAPKKFQKVKAPVGAQVFINSKAPLEGPDND